jgi:hypothetical protein
MYAILSLPILRECGVSLCEQRNWQKSGTWNTRVPTLPLVA